MEYTKKTAAVISFTSRGADLSREIIRYLTTRGCICKGYYKPRQSLRQWTGEQFSSAEIIIFIGAAGIAVRAAAPWIKDKYTDPAVLVVDEMGKFVIPILSGHVGGANETASALAAFLHAVPVITTATDLHGCFAVDVFARDRGLWISDREMAKRISAQVLEGKPVGVFSDFPLVQNDVPGCCIGQARAVNVYIGIWKREWWDGRIPAENTLQLVPKAVTLGVGCRKGIAPERFKEQVMEQIDAWGIWPQAVRQMASIDIKKEENAINKLCQEMNWEMRWFSSQELAEAEGDFSYSAFVEQTVGVGNVSERAAGMGATGPLLRKKSVLDGVALAAAWNKGGQGI